MLEKQFPLINGFYSTFLLSTMKPADQWIKNWRLHDKVINSAQFMLKKQFPLINGFYSTFLLSTMKPDQWIKNFIQICHCQSNHWVTVSTIGCQVGEIQGYIMKQTKKQSLHSKDYLDRRN